MPKRKSSLSICQRGHSVCDMKSDQPTQTSIVDFFLKKTARTSRKKRCTQPTTTTTTTLSVSHPPTPKRSNLANTKQHKNAKHSTQLYLDVGQRHFGQSIVCQVCGMLYVHGVAQDIDRHARVCVDYQEGVYYNTHHDNNNNNTIVPVPNLRQQKAQQVQAMVNQELGFVEEKEEKDSDFNTKKSKTTYWYVRDRRIVGVLRVQRIASAYPLIRNNHHNGGSSVETTPTRAVLGIDQLWVHTKHRHTGIATQLVNYARAKFVFGLSIPKQHIAFSSPTQDGLQFAIAYTSGDNHPVLVYDCVGNACS